KGDRGKAIDRQKAASSSPACARPAAGRKSRLSVRLAIVEIGATGRTFCHSDGRFPLPVGPRGGKSIPGGYANGERSDSKSDAPQGVAGSSPVPSASLNPAVVSHCNKKPYVARLD